MTKTGHIIFISTLVAIIMITLVFLLDKGLPFYRVSLEERFYHPDYNALKPSGIVGHGLGIIGSFFIVFGVGIYMARKRYKFLSRLGILKYWLEFHIFMCTLGPILILFHTSFKFGGLVAISFWSMVAVFLSGIVGRFIYIQIPRSIEGRALSLAEVRGMKTEVDGIVTGSYDLDEESRKIITGFTQRNGSVQNNRRRSLIGSYLEDRKAYSAIKKTLRKNKLPRPEYVRMKTLIKNDIRLNRKIERLDAMQNIFKYWHVVHSPFALVMLVIMVIHVAVAITMGYKWIF